MGTLYAVKICKGHSYGGASEGGQLMVTEPIARSLIGSKVAKAVDKLPPLPKASKPGTKSVRAGAVAHKAV